MSKRIAIKTGIGVSLGGLALYALSFIPPVPAEYRRMVVDMHPEPGLETLIFIDNGYEEDQSTHQFFPARSAVFIFSQDRKLLLKRESPTAGSRHIGFGMSNEFFNQYAQQVVYEEIDPNIRKYLPVPHNPTKEKKQNEQ